MAQRPSWKWQKSGDGVWSLVDRDGDCCIATVRRIALRQTLPFYQAEAEIDGRWLIVGAYPTIKLACTWAQQEAKERSRNV